jgi:DNA-binding response OmpR family regulator
MAKPRILVVEDHPTTARALTMYLETQGFAVRVAEDVASALETAKPGAFDLLICDLSLPDGTGWDLMKKLSARAPIRGIAYTASGSDADIARSMKVGFIKHLVKGCSTEELTAVIKDALNGSSPDPPKPRSAKKSR